MADLGVFFFAADADRAFVSDVALPAPLPALATEVDLPLSPAFLADELPPAAVNFVNFDGPAPALLLFDAEAETVVFLEPEPVDLVDLLAWAPATLLAEPRVFLLRELLGDPAVLFERPLPADAAPEEAFLVLVRKDPLFAFADFVFLLLVSPKVALTAELVAPAIAPVAAPATISPTTPLAFS